VIIIFSLPVQYLFPQEIPYPVNNYGIYEFLDELSGNQIISLNSAIKPYSRLHIAGLLSEAGKKRNMLTPRQQKELDFYMKEFCKELNDEKNHIKRKDFFYYKDSIFTITVNPILGAELFLNSSGEATYWRNGAEAWAYIRKWGFYASLRDNHEKPLLSSPAFLSPRTAGHIKNSTDWSEMKGGVTFSWQWGNIGLVKENIQWGNNCNGANIFGGNNPSFVHLRLHISPVRWFDFNYFHGWLNSMVVDSTRSYWVKNSYGSDYREVYHKKFIAANILTVTPFKYLNISAGNSIIYSDIGFSPYYLIPLFFYKSVDHSVNSGINNMNSQMFVDISSRQIKHLHLYAVLFVDEFSINRIFKKDEWNFLSWKTGFRLIDFPLPDLSLTAEFTYTYPLCYQHCVPTLTFESNRYNLGHYLKDNSREFYAALDYHPFRTAKVTLFFLDAVRGPDYNALGGSRLGNPPLASIEWHNSSAGLKASCQLINDFYLWGSLITSKITGNKEWSPEYFYGRKTTLNAGFTFGF